MYYNEKLQQIFLIFKTQNSWAVTSLITTLVFNRINNYKLNENYLCKVTFCL